MSQIKKDDKKDEEDNSESKIWTLEQEELLAEWAEKAACYRWLHHRSEKRYRCRNFAFSIPVIVLSTLTGTANFAMDSFVPQDSKQMAMGIVGGFNIFTGILTTLQNFLRFAELMEGHRSSSVLWSKFARNITVELALDTKRRKPAGDFLKICRAEFDRLIEQSPMVDDIILKQFEYHFKENDIIRPEICNGLKKCKIYKPSEEEKIATVVANAGSKLLNKRKDNMKTAKSWRRIELESPKKIIKVDNIPEPKSILKVPEPVKELKEVKEVKEDNVKIDIVDTDSQSIPPPPPPPPPPQQSLSDSDENNFLDGIQ